MKMRKLTIRKWLIVAWLSYALLPGAALGIVYGILWLITGHDPSKAPPLMSIAITAAVCVQISVLLAAGLFMGHGVRRPLAAISQASRQVAAGDLDSRVPSSPVREVAEVSDAFSAMGHDLRAALSRQAELEQERRFFIGAIAHDLRTPLFSLRGYLEGLAQGVAATPEKAAHYVAVCQEKADELERLVADLFAYTQVDTLEQRMLREPLDFAGVLARAVDGIRPQAEVSGIALTVRTPEEPCAAEGDALLLTRAIGNLLDNALRHTPSGGAVRVMLRPEQSRWAFSVADTGGGIAPGDLPHIFEPLYRGEASRNRQTGGSGLGLAIARRILVAHGGDLTATNLPEGGAELRGTLPRQSVTATDEAARPVASRNER